MKTQVELSQVELQQLPGDNWSFIKEACKMWSDVYFTVSMRPRLFLSYGPAGTFKTTMSEHFDLGGKDVIRIPINPDCSWPELRGYYGMGKSGMEWMDGPCTTAWRKSHEGMGCRLVIDELIEAGGDTIAGLHMITDGSKIAKMTLPTGEVLRPGENFQCFATMNAEPAQLPVALNDRFAVKREILWPDPRFLFSLPIKARPAASYCLFNKGAADNALKSLTTRSWVQISEFVSQGHDLKSAMQAIVGYKLVNSAYKAVEAAAAKVAVAGATL